MTDPRDRLARAQAELVAALVLGKPAPAGFPADQVRATARVLRHKRASAIAGHWPLLAHALGAELLPAVERLLGTTPPRGGVADGWLLAGALHAAGTLPADALGELLAARATFRCRDGTLVRRRGVSVQVGRCGGRTVVVLRVGRRLRRVG